MQLHVIARGKIGRSPEAELVERYAKRIAWPLKLTELPDSGGRIPEPLTPFLDQLVRLGRVVCRTGPRNRRSARPGPGLRAPPKYERSRSLTIGKMLRLTETRGSRCVAGGTPALAELLDLLALLDVERLAGLVGLAASSSSG